MPPLVHLPKPLTYTDSACLALAYSTQEKPVPSRALKTVLVKVVKKPKPSHTSRRLVESINAACSSKAGKVLDTQKFHSGDIVIMANSYETKDLI